MELVCASTANSSGRVGVSLYTWKDPLSRLYGVVAGNETQARAIVVAALVLPGLFRIDGAGGATSAVEVGLLLRFVGHDAAAQEEVLKRTHGVYEHARELAFALTVCREAPVITDAPVSIVFKAERDGCIVIGGAQRSGVSKWAPAAGAGANGAGAAGDDDAMGDEEDAQDDAAAEAECKKKARRGKRARARAARRAAGAAAAAAAATE